MRHFWNELDAAALIIWVGTVGFLIGHMAAVTIVIATGN
jgi:hypothetical protein